MSIKQFQTLRLTTVVLLSAFISFCITTNNYFLPVVGIAIAMIVLTMAKQKVNEVLADERDYNMAGTSARWSITIFSALMVVGIFILFSLKDKNPEYENISSLLAYLTCGLMLLNSVIFQILKYKESKK